ncbi:MAG: hypothetical protein Q8R78_04415 [Candidatus Omnitrophota bacterium]|nr:hypothetical protein [Candidatus Omnitrophota bacterium]
MGKRFGMVLVLALGVLAAPMLASAASSWAEGVTYGEKVTGKLKYGLTNTLLGWTSLFREPVQASQAGENVFVGLSRGVWNAVGQTVGGAVHAVTFPIPQIDIPLPEGGTDLLQ